LSSCTVGSFSRKAQLHEWVSEWVSKGVCWILKCECFWHTFIDTFFIVSMCRTISWSVAEQFFFHIYFFRDMFNTYLFYYLSMCIYITKFTNILHNNRLMYTHTSACGHARSHACGRVRIHTHTHTNKIL
jgi:hypothetical protein